MMLSMIGLKVNSRCVSAVTACLVALALFVGPLCAGTCAGSTCAAQAANSNEGTGCHGMTHEHGVHFAAATLNGNCRATEASFAVASKPDFSVRSTTNSCEGKIFSVGNQGIVRAFAASSKLFLASDGPPPGNPSSNVDGLVLRI